MGTKKETEKLVDSATESDVQADPTSAIEAAKAEDPDEDDEGDEFEANDHDYGDDPEDYDEEEDLKGEGDPDKDDAPVEGLIIDNAKDFETTLSKAGFPHQYDSTSDMFTVHFGARIVGGAKLPELGVSKSAFGTKAGNAPDFHPTDEELGKINQLTNKPYTKEALKVYYTYSSDGAVDSHFEQFGLRAHESMAKMSYDQPVLKDHDYSRSDGVFGKIFDAKVVRSKDGSRRLVQKIYILNSVENKEVIDGIESGVNNKLSIGVRLRRKDYKCNVCKKPMFSNKETFGFCGHMPGMELEDGTICTATIEDIVRFLELSRVTVPAVSNAGIKSYDAMAAAVKLNKSFEVSKALQSALDMSKLAAKGDTEDVAKISIVHQINDEEKDMSGNANAEQESAKTEQKTNEQPAEQTQVAPVSSEVSKSASEAIEQLVGNFNEGLKTITASFEMILTMQNAQAAQTETALTELVKLTTKLVEQKEGEDESLKQRDELHTKQIGETRELLLVVVQAHKDLAQKCGFVVQKSNEEIARMVAASKAMPGNRAEIEAKAKQDGGGDFYLGVGERFR